jgi:hypothetical protein
MCAPPRAEDLQRLGGEHDRERLGRAGYQGGQHRHERVEVPLPRLPVDVFYGEGEGLGRLLARAGVLG